MKSIKVFNVVFKDRYSYRVLNIVFQTFLFVLFLMFTTLFFNVNVMMQKASSKLTFYVFIKSGTEVSKLDETKKIISNWPEVNTVKLIPKDEGLSILKKSLGQESSIINSIETNPLPETLEINIKADFAEPNAVSKIQNKLKSYEIFDWVDSTQKQLAPLLAMKSFFNKLFATAVLALIITIFITLRISTKNLLYRYRKPLSLLKLLGATQSFIAVPFVIEGVLETFISSIVSSLATFFISDFFISQFSQINIPMFQLPSLIYVVFIVSVCIVGALSGLTFSKIREK